MSERAGILYDSRWRGPHGIGRFAVEVARRIPGLTPLSGGLPLFHPLDPVWLSWRIRRSRPAVYFSPGFNAPLATPDTPLVFVVHDLNYVHVAANTTVAKRAYFATVVKPACRRAARVLTVSEYSRTQILEWAGIEPRAVLNVSAGVDGAYVADGAKYSAGFPYILFAGSQAPHKNLQRLVQALARSRAAGEVSLLVTGAASVETNRWLHENNLHSHVAFAGVVPDGMLPSYYRGAVALAMPSLYEGFGLPVIEAMACGTPVLASTATSLPEVAGNAAVLVDPLDVDAIAHGLDRIVFDETLRSQLSARGLARARLFSWDKTAAAINDVLSAAVA